MCLHLKSNTSFCWYVYEDQKTENKGQHCDIAGKVADSISTPFRPRCESWLWCFQSSFLLVYLESRNDPSAWAAATHMADPHGRRSSWLWPGPIPVVTIWRMSQCVEDLSFYPPVCVTIYLFVCLFIYLLIIIFKLESQIQKEEKQKGKSSFTWFTPQMTAMPSAE